MNDDKLAEGLALIQRIIPILEQQLADVQRVREMTPEQMQASLINIIQLYEAWHKDWQAHKMGN